MPLRRHEHRLVARLKRALRRAPRRHQPPLCPSHLHLGGVRLPPRVIRRVERPARRDAHAVVEPVVAQRGDADAVVLEQLD